GAGGGAARRCPGRVLQRTLRQLRLAHSRGRRSEPPVVEGLGVRAPVRRTRGTPGWRRALLLAATAAVGTRGRAAVRQERPLRRLVLQLQPQLPPARRTADQPLVRGLPEVPF